MRRSHVLRLSQTIVACLLAFLACHPEARANDLSVPYVPQVYKLDNNMHSIGYNWCWAGCSTMLLNYYGYSTGISNVVAYGVGNMSYDTENDMTGGGRRAQKVVVWSPAVTIPVAVGSTVYSSVSEARDITYNGIDRIVSHFSGNVVPTQMYYSALTADQIDTEINTNAAPFVIRYQWTKPNPPNALDGGHFVVCKGYTSGILAILDPADPPATSGADSYMQSLATITAGGAGSLHNEADTHAWTHALTTSKALDIVFLFDTTGSMGSYISDAQSQSLAILNTISTKFKNYRVAVADYKDEPPPDGTGDYGDYVYRVDQPFVAGTGGNSAVTNAINSLGAEGGGDIPEAVFSALYNTLSGNGLQDSGGMAWRTGDVRRLIILIGDAPGHQPEAFPGGHDFFDVVPLAMSTKISVNCINPGTAADTTAQFQQITAATGGAFVDGTTGVSAGAETIVNTVDANPRFPQGTTGSIFPAFTFDPAGGAAMGNSPSKSLLEIEKYNTRFKRWSLVQLATLNPTATAFTSRLPLATGNYRWRLGFRQPANSVYLPAINREVKTPASTVFETDFTEFDRVANPPNAVTIISPDTQEVETRSVTYSFGAVPGASHYALQIFKSGRLWRNLKVHPPASDPGASVLSVTVNGHVIGQEYSWRVQGLNFDRPHIDPEAWTYSE